MAGHISTIGVIEFVWDLAKLKLASKLVQQHLFAMHRFVQLSSWRHGEGGWISYPIELQADFKNSGSWAAMRPDQMAKR